VPVILNIPPVPVAVIAPVVPKAITRVLVFALLNPPVVKVKLLRFNVPLYNTNELSPNVNALPNVRVPPTTSKVTGTENITLLVVIVLVALMTTVPALELTVVVDDKVRLPNKDKLEEKASEQVAPVVFKDKQLAFETVILGDPELALTIALSGDPGTPAPPEPPEVKDQCVVSVSSQVPLPPTQ
jgi:hypothetical protein